MDEDLAKALGFIELAKQAAGEARSALMGTGDNPIIKAKMALNRAAACTKAATVALEHVSPELAT